MTPNYLNSQPFPFSLEYHEDDHQHHDLLITSPKSQASSSSSCTMFSNPNLDQGVYHHGEIHPLEHQHEADTFVSHGGSYDHPTLVENECDDYRIKLPIWKKKINENEDQRCEINVVDNNGSAKWMSSKMRLMRKMMNGSGGIDQLGAAADIQINTSPMFGGGDHKQLISSPFETDHNKMIKSHNSIIRVCSDCNTTKTPLWRSGPRGPKSLCNACGIRQRKARRAMAAAAAAAANGGTILAAAATTSHVKTKAQHKDKKKRSKKLAAAAAPSSSTTGRSQKLCFEDFTLRLSEKYAAFQRVFPQDEKEEAAILLMALSYGLAS